MVSITNPFYPKRISVQLCEAKTVALSPKGYHLRWFVPKSLGFPSTAFNIYKVKYEEWEKLKKDIVRTCIDFRKEVPGLKTNTTIGKINWSQKSSIQPIGEYFEIITSAQTQLLKTNEGVALKETGKAQHLLLRFREPLIYLHIESETGDVQDKTMVKSFYKSVQIGSTFFSPAITFEQPNITDVLIPLAFKHIKRICFVREKDVIHYLETRRDLSATAHLPIPDSAAKAYELAKPTLQEGIANRFIQTSALTEFAKKYKVTEVSHLIKKLQETLNHPGKTIAVPAQNGLMPTEVPILNYINLAALDPNIAQMLGLYWVDPAMEKCLYAIQGVYSLPAYKYLYGFAFTHATSKAPSLQGKVMGKQLPGITYQDSKPLGQVGLQWNRNVNDYQQTNKPVFYDLYRKTEQTATWVTEKKPQMANSKTPYCFREDKLPVGQKISYEVFPIDIFGRVGKGVSSNVIELKDLDRPVPPKNVKAKVWQNGFPWSIPAERKEPDIKTGTVHVSLEYGETQHRISPDAKALKIVWKEGSKDDSFHDPATWTTLDELKVQPPLAANITWNNGITMSEFSFAIKEIIEKTPEALSQHLDRLDFLTKDAADEVIQQEETRLELLIDRTLLEPNLFKDYTLTIGNETFHIIDAHAGVGYDDDSDPLHQHTARLIVRKDNTSTVITAGATGTVYYEGFENISAQAITQWIYQKDFSILEDMHALVNVQLNQAPTDHEKKASGGELAIDYHYLTLYNGPDAPHTITPVHHTYANEGKLKNTFVGRVVSEVQSHVNGCRLMVRLKAADFLHLLLIEKQGQTIQTEGRYYAPYVIANRTLGLNGENGNIKIDMPPGQRFTTLWFSACTEDQLSNTSSEIAVPFETRVVNPPPVVAASIPYPCDGDVNTPKAYASPPNYEGFSTLCLQWDAVQINGTNVPAVRYELARALDKTIVAVDRQNWEQGRNSSHHSSVGIVKGAVVNGELKAVMHVNNNGTFTVKVKNPNVALFESLKLLEKGRIRIAHTLNGNVQNIFHKIVRISRESPDILIVCRPHVELSAAHLGQIASGAAFEAEGMPDYTPLLSDDAKLRSLADEKYTSGSHNHQYKNSDAFGMVTGVPIGSTQFIDTIPGRGTNRYFYKLRAVFSNDQKSEWSPCSMGYYQLDLLPPQPPIIYSHYLVNEQLFLFIEPPREKNVAGFKIYKQNAAHPNTTQPLLYKTLWINPENPSQEKINKAHIYQFAGLINLQKINLFSAQSSDVLKTMIRGIYTLNDDGSVDNTQDFLLPDTVIKNGMVQAKHAALPHGVSLAIKAMNTTEQTITQTDRLFEFVDEVTESGKTTYTITALKKEESKGIFIESDTKTTLSIQR